ncbi:MAG: MCP four helix bundle domain-containing protein [Cyclobacteriaceae bacterium]
MFTNKIKWILGISVVFLLIIATNYVDRSNFRRVQDSIETIYEDRLVAQDLVFKMSLIIQHKVLDYSISDSAGMNKDYRQDNANMDSLLIRFHETRLTRDEAAILKAFEDNFAEARRLEEASEMNVSAYEGVLQELNENILSLSKIQMDEGRRQMFEGEKALKSVNLLTTIEVYVLVFLAILIQVIILYNPNKKNTD